MAIKVTFRLCTLCTEMHTIKKSNVELTHDKATNSESSQTVSRFTMHASIAMPQIELTDYTLIGSNHSGDPSLRSDGDDLLMSN